MKKPDLNNNIGYLFNTVTNALNTFMQREITQHDIEVPFEQLKLLMFISFHEGVNQQLICSKMNKAKPGISRLVDSLVKKKLVDRREDQEDRRNKKLFATEKGIELRNRFYPIGFSNLQSIESELGEQESAELKKHLIAIKEIILNRLNTEK
ncbi:MAG: hypothetical protein CL840_05660 [Crocinitomicaceae bacterium]|nr:hypothetical protein [Crocinitomicaceae bacterium]|tara:strand:+ start:162 stop:617 length:456 start_codon:yes stop_codon:yes gene_type:complete